MHEALDSLSVYVIVLDEENRSQFISEFHRAASPGKGVAVYPKSGQ
jgi:hypothetical protein